MRHSNLIALFVMASITLAIQPPAYADNAASPSSEGVISEAPLIVIDPGHGGSNSGAQSVDSNIYEKHVTLALAHTLEQRLREAGYRVLLTREGDEYLTLKQRVVFANRADADLFVSLHTNATENHARRGYETFILSPHALDVDSRALRTDAGAPRADVDQDVATVLDDVERGLAQPAAAQFAGQIQGALREIRDPESDRGVRQDSMHVLLGALMPAVLMEVGFVDHVIEGRELLQRQTRVEICDALTRAIVATLPLSRQ